MYALVAVWLLAGPVATTSAQDETPPPVPVPDPSPGPAPVPVVPTPLSPWTWSLNEEGVFRSWEDNAETATRREDFIDGMNRLYGVVTRGGIEAGLQIDIAGARPDDRAGLTNDALVPPPGARSGVWLADEDPSKSEYAVVLEKKFLRWRGSRGSIEIGDAYRAVGRGLGLALVRNTELDIDTSLEGVSSDVTLGPFELSGWGGYSNTQTVSTAFQNSIRRDPRDLLGGGRLAWSGPVELFVHAGGFVYDDEVPAQLFVEGTLVRPERARLAGGGFGLPDLGGRGDLHVEALALTLSGRDFGNTPVEYEGYGAYAALNLYLGALTVTVEAKSYDNLELLNVRGGEGFSPFDYVTPPTLEKENVVNYNVQKAVNSNRIHGGKGSVSFPIGGGFLGRVTYARFDDLGHRLEEFDGVVDENERIDHAYVSVEKRGEGIYFQVTAGGRQETRLERPDVHETLVHADGDLLVPFLWKGSSLELKALAYRQTETSGRTGFERTSDVTSWVASLRPFSWGSIAALVDTTNDDRVLTGLGARKGNLSDYTFGGVEVSVEPTDQSSARLFAGATQGGLKCSGGTCRIVPAFEGVRVEWLARF